MVSKRYSRKKKGGNKWNCNCTLASDPSTTTVVAVPAKKTAAATKLQTAVRQKQAAKNLTTKKAAATKLQAAVRKTQAVKKVAAKKASKSATGGTRKKYRKKSRKMRHKRRHR